MSKHPTDVETVKLARIRANKNPPFDGTSRTAHLIPLMTYRHIPGVTIIFTRDAGHHACGWFRNPDYERCYHLSLSFHGLMTNEPAPYSHREASKWIRMFFDPTPELVWSEPPYSPDGKRLEVWHHRLFMDHSWRHPVFPRREVYSTEFTELGWKSFSELSAPQPLVLEATNQ